MKKEGLYTLLGTLSFALLITRHCLNQFSYKNIPFEIMNTMKKNCVQG